jgi:hypothetical protein
MAAIQSARGARHSALHRRLPHHHAGAALRERPFSPRRPPVRGQVLVPARLVERAGLRCPQSEQPAHSVADGRFSPPSSRHEREACEAAIDAILAVVV